jgi:hypothetical protein
MQICLIIDKVAVESSGNQENEPSCSLFAASASFESYCENLLNTFAETDSLF